MKKNILYLCGFFLIFMTASCKKFLDRIPPHSLVEENAIVDGPSAEAALIGAFVPLKNMNPSPFDASYISNGSQMVGFTTGRFRGFDEDLELNAFNTGDAWTECSEIINASNAVIEKTAEISESKFLNNRKMEIIAEARFMRFFAQYYLFRHYGQFWDLNSKYGALMRRTPSKVSNNNYGRSTVEETYNLLFEDLNYVIANGPIFTTVYRPSKLLAKAYKAELLLMRGTNGDLQNAINLADEVLIDPKRKKENTYDAVFANGYNSSELLFTRYMDKQMLSNVFGNLASIVKMFGGVFTTTPLLESILANDVRASFYKRIDVVNGLNVVRVPKLFKADGNCLPYYMRTSEMDLIKAEAYARLNQKDNAINAVNVLRLRAGEVKLIAADIVDNNLSKVIFSEIAKEMALENGYEWFAALRLKGADGRSLIYTLKPTVTAIKQFVWPIPQKETELNKLMIQNPGYEGI